MKKIIFYITIFLIAGIYCLAWAVTEPNRGDYAPPPPLFLAAEAPPLVMLTMARDHTLYYEAYNDASDLNDDGQLDLFYNPQIEYYGYFDSYKCYVYSSSRFEPSGLAPDKKCSGAGEWSGDFLNYITMSRMDTLRKVLYGGFRSTDSDTLTVLERSFIPQDAHSWGKEYESVARDGYDISEYTPLALPALETRHLFANTTLSANGSPLLRVLDNSRFRIWEWVSIERPVAGTKCLDGGSGPNCATAGGTTWEIVPAENFINLTQTTYNISGYSGCPGNDAGFQTLVDNYAVEAKKFGSGPASIINGSGNPYGSNDYYMTIFEGEIFIPSSGTYTFAVDGDDAVELRINGNVVAHWYGCHGRCNCQTHSGNIFLTAGNHTIEFRHQEAVGDDYYYLYWQKTIPSSTMTDYEVRVKVCDPAMLESNCREYSAGYFKPVGLLQRYGEPERMYFGLLSGSYAKNISGGVLRQNISSINDEIDSTTGRFKYKYDSSVHGIIKTIDRFRVVGFDYGGHSYNQNCGWITTRPINEGECRMWGNPIGEMIYETMRYFAGKQQPTPDFDYTTGDDVTLGLPKPAWDDPYDPVDGFPYCSKPFMIVISDINPSYDSINVPGSAFSSFTGDLTGLDVSSLADEISSEEGISGSYFIGQSDSTQDGACTAKDVTGFGDIRGLCPEEPTKQGSYYSASAAYYGTTTDLRSDLDGDQKVKTYAVALSSPLPKIEIQVADNKITMVPFAKSVGGYSINRNRGSFQPTNTIVDFYVIEIGPTYGSFRVNFEDVEQGADHDMDAIVRYEYQVVDGDGNLVADPEDGVYVDVTLTSEYAAGSIVQHMGYIISGTTVDGIYLEVRDCDTANPGSSGCVCCGNNPSTDPDYFLDTPPGVGPNQGVGDTAWQDGLPLPLDAERRFTPSTGAEATAELIENPLWYAAKWGGFTDMNNNNIPDQVEEWDEEGDGVPDNYFFVANPLKLEEQLNKSFADILKKSGSGTAVSVLATKGEGEGIIAQAFFKPKVTDLSGLYDVLWTGYLQTFWVDQYGNLREDTIQNKKLDVGEDSIIKFFLDEDTQETKVRRFPVSEANPYPDTESASYQIVPLENLKPIWEAGDKLLKRDESDRKIFTSVETSLGLLDFDDVTNASEIGPFLGVENAIWDYLGDTYDNRVVNLIRFIRGVGDDPTDLSGNTNFLGTTRMRPRVLDSTDGTARGVWKLGDIVYSTPVAISKPVENYGLLYDDQSYRQFYSKYKNRETVVYVGANDGMLHAFSAGVYDPYNQMFYDPYDWGGYFSTSPGVPDAVVGQIEIGDEMWAYIPKSLLPHLKWLPYEGYIHVPYVDLKPKVIDARVFDPSDTHPEGWGTILIGGLNFGGKSIETIEKGTLGPCFFAIDITNPRNPQLMWENDYSNMGFTINMPTVIKVDDKWFLAIGSGPTDYDGSSNQPGRVLIVDLETGDLENTFETDDPLSYMNSPVSLDMAMNYNVDAIYSGANFKDGGDWKGRVYRITVPQTGVDEFDPTNEQYDTNANNWTITKLFESPGPFQAPFSLSMGRKNNVWIFAGTGRYLEHSDKSSSQQNYIFGLKDPFFNPDNNTDCYLTYPAAECEITMADLFEADVFSGKIKQAGIIEGVDGIDNFADLVNEARRSTYRGWYRELLTGTPSEKVLNKPSILGGIVLVPTFTPNDDICGYGGLSRLFALFYETGTAYKRRIVGDVSQETILDVVYLGEGLSSSFGVHLGKQEGGMIFGQMSTGEIVEVDVTPAFAPVSMPIYWKEIPGLW